MITRQEVKIDNYIKQGRIDCIHPQCVEVITEIKSRKFIDYYEAEPIPLTEQILIDFDFIKIGNHFCQYLNSADQSINLLEEMPDGWYPYLSQSGEMSFQETQTFNLEKINYVHQLQNLYYMLTGRDLNLKH